jgi:CspA family cold shock protein
MPTGTVKWFNATKGYGFIVPSDGSADVFVQMQKLGEAKITTLETGYVVTFSLGTKDGKVFAENLVLLSTDQPASVRKQREPPKERSPSEVTDADAEFERDWGLRRT